MSSPVATMPFVLALRWPVVGLLALGFALASAYWAYRQWQRHVGRQRQARLIAAHGRFAQDEPETWFSVGWANHRSFRVWYALAEGIEVDVRLSDAQSGEPLGERTLTLTTRTPFSTGAFELPEAIDPVLSLEPATRYRVRVFDGATVLLDATVETSNDGGSRHPERLSLGFCSCHQPFDDDGEVLKDARDMLRCAHAAFEHFGIGRLLFLGDQVYTDYPPSLSLFSDEYCRAAGYSADGNILTVDEATLRRAIEQRYRSFWRMPEFRRLLRSFPNAMMLDDHDIIDNWGSSTEHNGEHFQRLKRCAVDGWLAYQGLRVAEHDPEREGVDFAFSHGPIAAFVMDLRTEKYADDERVHVYSDRQLERLRAFLADSSDAPVVLLGLSVPFLQLPPTVMNAAVTLSSEDSDFADRWSNPRARRDRNRLLLLLKEHQKTNPRQKLAILSGDIHVGAIMRFTWEDGAGSFLQVASSAISNEQSDTAVLAANLLPGVNRTMDIDGSRLGVEMATVEGINPWGGLNVGVVDVQGEGDDWTVCARILAMTDDHSTWRQVSELEL